MYASKLGRFTTTDPIFIEMKRLSDPQRFNLFLYSRNNPLAYTDPLGMDIKVLVDEKLTDDEKKALYKKYETYLNKYFNGAVTVEVKNGNVSITAIDKEKLSKLDLSANQLVTAIQDSTYTGKVDLGNGKQRDDVAFGKAETFGLNKVDFADISNLDAGGVGISGADIVAHETLESYTTAKYHALEPNVAFADVFTVSHEIVITGGMAGLINPTTATPINCGQCNTTREATAIYQIRRGTGPIVGSFKATFKFDTPIPKADVEKAKFPKFEVTKVEKNK